MGIGLRRRNRLAESGTRVKCLSLDISVGRGCQSLSFKFSSQSSRFMSSNVGIAKSVLYEELLRR